MIRVLHVIDSLEPSGAEVSLAAMLAPLRHQGVDGAVAHFGSETALAARIRSDGFDVHAMGAEGRFDRVRAVRRLIAACGPDLVHTSLFEADVAGRLAARSVGVPVVSSLVNMQYGAERARTDGISRAKLAAARLVDANSARLVTRFHAITEAAAAHAARRLRIDPSLIEVVPRGRGDVALGRRTPARRCRTRAGLGWTGDQRVLLAVARHHPQKGLDVLVTAFARLSADDPSVRLALAGREGPVTPHLRDLAERWGVTGRIDWLGGRTDVADLMGAADVLVLPSRWEGLGGVLIEAMALELPIVASDLAPVREVLGDGAAGVLIPVGRADLLAAALTDVFDQPAGTAARIACGRRRFEERYTIDRVAEQLAGFYRRALGATG
jgi:glycosyltransferase involved in cell wall biosynthesis